jgi:hypothetical protein
MSNVPYRALSDCNLCYFLIWARPSRRPVIKDLLHGYAISIGRPLVSRICGIRGLPSLSFSKVSQCGARCVRQRGALPAVCPANIPLLPFPQTPSSSHKTHYGELLLLPKPHQPWPSNHIITRILNPSFRIQFQACLNTFLRSRHCGSPPTP